MGTFLQYLFVFVDAAYDPMAKGWDRYREYFDQCTNLKEIEISIAEHDIPIREYLPNFSKEHQKIWKERISYFQKRGIRLARRGDTYRNENLKNKLAKEAGIPWRFHFFF